MRDKYMHNTIHIIRQFPPSLPCYINFDCYQCEYYYYYFCSYCYVNNIVQPSFLLFCNRSENGINL